MTIDDATPTPEPAPTDAGAYWPEFPPCWDDYRAARALALRHMRPTKEPAETPILATALPLR